jgi:hypothetical protein
VFENVILKTFLIKHSSEKNIDKNISGLNSGLFIFPNPAENVLNIRFNVAEEGFVNISMYNVLGEKGCCDGKMILFVFCIMQVCLNREVSQSFTQSHAEFSMGYFAVK